MDHQRNKNKKQRENNYNNKPYLQPGAASLQPCPGHLFVYQTITASLPFHSLQHQQAFPMSTTVQQTRQARRTQPIYSSENPEWKWKPRSKAHSNQDKPNSQHLDLLLCQILMAGCQVKNTINYILVNVSPPEPSSLTTAGTESSNIAEVQKKTLKAIPIP